MLVVMKMMSVDIDVIIGLIDLVVYMYMCMGSVIVCGDVMKIDIVSLLKLLMNVSS